jgi:meso-butanediol dehydrogenase/(S,S)-butanediol dehydrogenase/diacetyl reductase
MMKVLSNQALAGRTVVVTGAARGIGAGIVEAVLDAGGNVVLIDLNRATATATAKLFDPEGKRTLATAADVSDRSSVERAKAAAIERFGRVNGWVNNAGIVKMAAAETIAGTDWDQEFAVNVKGVLNGAQTAFEAMKIDGGAIVNIASNAGKVGFPNMAAYNASKAAVINLTRSLSKEWAPYKINVNAVCPGSVATPMLMEVADNLEKSGVGDAKKLFAGMVPAQLGRHVTPLEVGRVVAFLLTDAAVIIRGQSVNIDGGETPY